MNIGICGISGRMGLSIFNILKEKNHNLTAAFDAKSSPNFGKLAGELINDSNYDLKISDINSTDLSNSFGVIDFSSPAATMKLIEESVKVGSALVIGTTGFSEEELLKIDEASKQIPILFSPNMSLGVNLLFKLTEIAAQALDKSYDVEIFEAHHKLKKDAPSGTAKRLIEAVRQMQGLRDAKEVHGREGLIGERSDNEIGVMTMRAGDIVGEHTVFFTAMGERIELTHRATNRDIFARGAVTAMEFLSDKKNGLYSTYDLLGF